MDEEFFDEGGSNLGNGEAFNITLENRKHRRRIARDVILSVIGILVVCAIVVGLVVLIVSGNGGPKIPDLVGKPYKEAKAKAGAAKFGIEVDSMQDSSVPHNDLIVIEQNPKPGSVVEEGEIIVVRLKGLYESQKATGDEDEYVSGSSESQTPAEENAGQGTTPGTAGNPPASSGVGKIVCLDPGHSTGCPSSEIDPATGLDVADNGGASGELTTNWEVASKAKAKLEQAGYTVKMTKSQPDMYASLRTRADIGNTCSIVIRIHFDPELHALLYPAEGQYKQHGNSIKYVEPDVAAGSGQLANALFPYLQNVGISSKRNDSGGTSGNTGSAFVGSVLSAVPTVLIENDPSMVKGNAAGQDKVADAIVQGVNAYFNR